MRSQNKAKIEFPIFHFFHTTIYVLPTKSGIKKGCHSERSAYLHLCYDG